MKKKEKIAIKCRNFHFQKNPGSGGGIILKIYTPELNKKNMKKEIHFLGTTIYIYVPVTSNLHTSVLNNGSVVSPRGFRQINCLVPGEPFRQERSANTKRTSSRYSLYIIQSINQDVIRNWICTYKWPFYKIFWRTRKGII